MLGLADATPFLGKGAGLLPTADSESCRDRRFLDLVGGAPRREPPAPLLLDPPCDDPLVDDDVDEDASFPRGEGALMLTGLGAPVGRRTDRGVVSLGVEEDEDDVEVDVASSVPPDPPPPAVPLLHEMLLLFDFFLRAAVSLRMGCCGWRWSLFAASGRSIMTIPFRLIIHSLRPSLILLIHRPIASATLSVDE